MLMLITRLLFDLTQILVVRKSKLSVFYHDFILPHFKILDVHKIMGLI